MANTHVTELTPIEIEKLHRYVRKALAIALALSEQGSVEDHENYIGLAISENLHEAKMILEGEEAAMNKAREPKLSEVELQRIGKDIHAVSDLIASIHGLVRYREEGVVEHDALMAAIQALCEKAGVISDRCAKMLGGGMFVGSYDDWTGLGRLANESDAEASEARHG